jgi:anti-sigma-K factor RskA
VSSARDTQVRPRTTGHSPAGTGETTRAPHAPTRRREIHPPLPPVAPEPRPAQDDRRIDGLGPLWVFLVASLAIVGAVVLAGAVDRWWILVPVMCVFFASTFGVLASIMRLLRDSGDTL